MFRVAIGVDVPDEIDAVEPFMCREGVRPGVP